MIVAGRLILPALGLVLAVGSGVLAAAPQPTAARADVSYGPHPHQLLDLYLPPQGKGPFPVVIWYGALWTPKKHVPPVWAFLPAGCAAIGVQARVMGDAVKDNIHPPVSVCLLDARQAVQFVRLHAAQWNLDPGLIAVGGSLRGEMFRETRMVAISRC